MIRIVVVRHGPFFSDPRVVKECLALAQDGRFDIEALTRGTEIEEWIVHPRLKVTTISSKAPAENPFLIALQAAAFGIRVLGRVLRDPPQIVVVHSIPSWLLLILLPVRLARRAKLMLDHHEPEAEMLTEAGVPAQVAKIYSKIESLSLKRADCVIDVSKEMADRSASLGARTQFIVENAPRIFINRHRSEGPPRWDLAVFGSLIRRYDLDVLSDALSHLEVPIDVLQVGDGRSRLNVNPSRGKLSSYRYLSPPRLQERLRQCRLGFVGLNPSTFTSYISPNRLWELAALEIPIVVAETPLLRELAGDNAFFYEGGSSRSLAETILAALATPDGELADSARAVRDHLHERSWEVTAPRFVELFAAGSAKGDHR